MEGLGETGRSLRSLRLGRQVFRELVQGLGDAVSLQHEEEEVAVQAAQTGGCLASLRAYPTGRGVKARVRVRVRIKVRL